MTRVACVADCHIGPHQVFGGPSRLGLNARCWESVEVLKRAVAVANAERAETLLVVGDLFDSDRPSPQLIHAVRLALAKFRGGVILVRGNHDARSDDPRDNALHAACPQDGWVIDRVETAFPHDHGQVLAAYPSTAAPMREAVPAWLRTLTTGLAVFHAGLETKGTPHFLKGGSHAVPLDAVADAVRSTLGLDVVLCGDWHEHQIHHVTRLRPDDGYGPRRAPTEEQVPIIQIGSLCPTGFDDLSPVHGVVMVDLPGAPIPARVTVHPIPGPRFIKAVEPSRALWDRIACLGVAGEATGIYLSLHPTTPEGVREARAACERYSMMLAGWRVVPDVKATVAKARAQARSVAAAPTLEAALAHYVGAVQAQPAGVAPAEVLAACRGHLARPA